MDTVGEVAVRVHYKYNNEDVRIALQVTPYWGNPIYQLKITLKDIRPPIWRRVQVPSDITLGQLHWVDQLSSPFLQYSGR